MIKILADTSCDLPLEIRERYNVTWVPFNLLLGEEAYRDRDNITIEEFYQRLRRNDCNVKTAQVNGEDLKKAMEELLVEPDDQIIVFTLSSTLSGTFNAAVKAAEEVDGTRIHVPDFQRVSLLNGDLIMQCGDLIEKGKTVEEILPILEAYSKTQGALLLVETLEYLKKGGRISFVESVIGGLLNIKPILEYNTEGKVVPLVKVRGMKQGYNKLLELTKERHQKGHKLFVMHSDNLEGALVLKQMLEEYLNDKVDLVDYLGPVLATHTGPGGIFVGY